ncbi:hypothetical protein [Mesorhizobium sp. M0895]|uniref:hypothetical protein n=1 Tax=Mesorhizobium sp. M0895 TaxID=2957019 RepID=UPI003337CF99
MVDVVPLRKHPPVGDIIGQLRQMANWIESGEVEARSALFIIPSDGDWPEVYGWGEHLGDYGNIAICEITKTWFINNLVAR